MKSCRIKNTSEEGIRKEVTKTSSSQLNHLTGAGFGRPVAPPHVNPLLCVKYGVPDTQGKQNLTMLAFFIAPTDSHFSPGFYYIRHFETSLHRLGY